MTDTVANEQSLATETATITSEDIPAAATDTTEETVETDEEKNKRVLDEAAEKARQKEERRQQSVQKRIDELTADKYAARNQAEQLAKQNAQILALLEGKNTQQAQYTGEPLREQYESYEDFVTARAEYRADQKVTQALEKFQRTQQETETRAKQEQSEREAEKQFLSRREAVAKEFPDFQDVIDEWRPQLPDAVANMIIRLPDGPLLSYHLAKNPSLEAQFREQPEYMHGILLGQLISSLKVSTKVTNAPAPGKPLGNKSSPSNEAPSDPALYMAWAKKNLR
jgi:chemotaxis protein histidine kinase CheA